MEQITLKQYYPSGGKVVGEIAINNVEATVKGGVFIGQAKLPSHLSAALSNQNEVQKVVIYQLTLTDGSIDYRCIPAACPHQGADITLDLLKPDGNVYCALHRRPICLYSEYNQAFNVEKREDQYFIVNT